MNTKWIFFITIGIILRLVFAYCMTYSSDFIILTLHIKSVALTGNLFDSMHAMLKVEENPQLYGKIWYQMWGVWIQLLARFHFISMDSINLSKHIVPYQQFLIKLFQMVFDALILFFTYKIAIKLAVKRLHFIILFWAFNPLWIYITYSMLQSDIAMLTCLLASIYITIKYKKFNYAAIILLSLAFVIKMMPILLLPIFILYTHKSNKLTLFSFVEFALITIIIMQPWSNDFLLMRQFGLSSREALGIFHETWNGASVFILMYTSFIFFLWHKRKLLQSSGTLFIVALTATILIVYLGETHVLLFPQFMTWIMPFAAILVAQEISLFPVLIAPFTNFIFAAVINNAFLSGALADLTGIKTKTSILAMFSQMFHEKFLTTGLRTLFVGLCVFFLYYCILQLNRHKFLFDRAYRAFSEKWGILSIIMFYQLYYVFFFLDFFIQKTYK